MTRGSCLKLRRQIDTRQKNGVKKVSPAKNDCSNDFCFNSSSAFTAERKVLMKTDRHGNLNVTTFPQCDRHLGYYLGVSRA
jgi:acyl CoA:acetate/3-ketoacid CoA transferase